jgi:hypothetical protein
VEDRINRRGEKKRIQNAVTFFFNAIFYKTRQVCVIFIMKKRLLVKLIQLI